MRHHIIIIGGGPAGVSAFIQLVDQYILKKQNNIGITIVEKSSNLGPGLPFSTEEPDHILNLPSDFMSPNPNAPDLFAEWLLINADKFQHVFPDIELRNNKFPPRYIYGQFLMDIANKTKELAESKGINVVFLTNCEATDITPYKGSKYIVDIANGVSLVGTQLLLCTGHLSSDPYRKYKSNPGYIHNPWPSTNFTTRIAHDKDVVIIGSRLTAIDVALALKRNGHEGKMLMVSRNGQLPKVLGPVVPYERKFLTIETLNEFTLHGLKSLTIEQLLDLFWKELSVALGREVDKSILYPDKNQRELLEKEIVEAKKQPRNWQCLLMSLYPIVPDIWKTLDIRSKEAFLKDYYSPFLTHLAAFPIINAEKILALLKSGQLEIKSGVKGLVYDENSKNYFCYTNSGIIKTDSIINATGPGYFGIKQESSLFSSLEQKGLIHANQFGGIDVEFNSLRVINNRGKVLVGFHAAGEVTRGIHFATTDLGQATRYVKRAVYVIINNTPKIANSSLFRIASKGNDNKEEEEEETTRVEARFTAAL